MRIVEDGGVLPYVLPVFSRHSYVFEAGKKGLQVFKLVFEAFLCAEDVEFVEADDVCNRRAAPAPDISTYGVLPVLLAKIVGGHVELCGTRRKSGGDDA